MRSKGLKLAIKAKGGVNALARALGISSAAIAQWREVPADRVPQVELVTRVPCWELRPDLYRTPDTYDLSRDAAAS